MDWAKKSKLMFRWSIVTAAAIALFWTIWYLVAGNVPEVSSCKMTPDWTVVLPFAVSRWWDVLLGPVYSILVILLVTSERIRKNEDVAFALDVVLGAGLIAGLSAGLIFGPGAGLIFGPGVGLGVGLAVGLIAGLAYGLFAGLVFGLGVGLGVGLGAGLVFGLVFGLGVGLVVGLKYLFSSQFLSAVGRWLVAK